MFLILALSFGSLSSSPKSDYILMWSRLFILFSVFKSMSIPTISSVKITPWVFLLIQGASGRDYVDAMLIFLIILRSGSNFISGGTTSGRQKDSLNLSLF